MHLGIIFLEVMDRDASEKNMHCFFLQICREHSFPLPARAKWRNLQRRGLFGHSQLLRTLSIYRVQNLYRCDLVLHKCCHAHYRERDVLKLAKYMPAFVLLFEAVILDNYNVISLVQGQDTVLLCRVSPWFLNAEIPLYLVRRTYTPLPPE